MANKPPYKVPSMEVIQNIKWNGFNVVSTFSGAGGSCLGYRLAGFRVLWANEFIPAAQEVYKRNHPNSILDTRDIRKVKPNEILEAIGLDKGEIDIFDGSPPCFVGDTPILTYSGYKFIKDVQIGDLVLTKKLRWRKVTEIHKKIAEETVIVNNIIECTPNHRFWSRSGKKLNLQQPKWVQENELQDKYLGIPQVIPHSSIPPCPKGFEYNNNFWWVVGRWLGDGWVRHEIGDTKPFSKPKSPYNMESIPCRQCSKPSRKNKQCTGKYFTNYCSKKCKDKWKRLNRKSARYEVFICGGYHEEKELKDYLDKLKIKVGMSRERTTVKFRISRKSFVLWLVNNFGKGAAGKTVPAFILSMKKEWRQSLFDGYVSADGHRVDNSLVKYTTISKCLRAGIDLLSQTLNMTTSTSITKGGIKTIEGRVVKTNTAYIVSATIDTGRYTIIENNIRWVRHRRKVKKGGTNVVVYDLGIEQDHSFVADTYIVHNCSAFSTAGKREKGWGQVKQYSDTKQRVDDLFFEYSRLLEGLQPKIFVAENVSGLVKGKAKGYFKEILSILRACGYNVKTRVLNAQWLGVPQSRQRLIFIGVRNDLQKEPVYPKPLTYYYSVKDAIPWITRIQKDKGITNPVVWVDSKNVSSHIIGTSPSTGNGRVRYVESETDISKYAIGKEWDNIKQGQASDKYLNLKKPSLNKPSQCITQMGGSSSAASVVHPLEKRKFSIAELKRIMAFPDDFIVTGSYQKQWERLGRAVPPVMMSYIAKTIQKELLEKL